MMSQDECDFEAGDVGNRSLTRLVWVWVWVGEIVWGFYVKSLWEQGFQQVKTNL